MKKLLALAVVAFAVATTVGCGSASSSAAPKKDPPATTPGSAAK